MRTIRKRTVIAVGEGSPHKHLGNECDYLQELTKTGGMWLTSQTRHCSGALAHVQNLCKTCSGEQNWNT